MSMILILTHKSFIFYRPDKNKTKPVKEVWALPKISVIPVKERGGDRPVWLSGLPPKPCTSHIWPCQSPSAMAGEISTPHPWEVLRVKQQKGWTDKGRWSQASLEVKGTAGEKPKAWNFHSPPGGNRDNPGRAWPESLLSVGEEMRIFLLSERSDHWRKSGRMTISCCYFWHIGVFLYAGHETILKHQISRDHNFL